jgi:hypothetical protein
MTAQRSYRLPSRSPELYRRVTEMYAAGQSLDAIAVAEGCSAPRISRLLREAGVTLRPRSSGVSDCLRFVPNRDRAWRPEGEDAA